MSLQLMHMTDYRLYRNGFGCQEIKDIWCEDAILQDWIDFEKFLAQAQGELGLIPQAMADEIIKNCRLDRVTTQKIADNFAVTNLTTVSMIRALAEHCAGNAGEYIHLGATSQDMLDSTLARRLKKTLAIYERDLLHLHDLLCRLADEHRHTVMPGITHGQHALPITFGFMAAMWAQSIILHVERIRQATPRICVGSVSGAAGNLASFKLLFGNKAMPMAKRVYELFGIFAPTISEQPRHENLNEYMYICAQISNTFEKIADDIFFQQRNEVMQLEEPFDTEHQICSSTMPQKRNPVRCENIKALATRVRFNAGAFAELHMRDLRDDSGFFIEDMTMPETAVVMDTMIKTAIEVIEGLTVKPANMRRNLELGGGLTMSECLALTLARKTGKKDAAMRIMHAMAMESFEKNMPYRDYCKSKPELLQYMTPEEIDAALDPMNYLGLNDELIDQALAYTPSC